MHLLPTSGALRLATTLLCFAASLTVLSASSLPSSSDWTNLSFQKQLDLAGSVSHLIATVTLQSHVRLSSAPLDAASDAAQFYYFILPADEASALSWSRATVRPAASSVLGTSGSLPSNRRPVLDVTPLGPLDGDSDTHLFSVGVPLVALPQASNKSSDGKDTVQLTLEATLNHITVPLPATGKQTDPQFLLWTGDVHVRSPYPSKSARIKVKTAHPKILSYEPSEATKAGSTVTFGPYEDVKPHTKGTQVGRGKVHYQHDSPVVSIVSLDRTMELSHWADTLSIRDRFWLRNDGPVLKGHLFSRIEHQMTSFYRTSSSHTLSNLAMHLPPGARDAYFIDQVGNVSTSHFRPLPAGSTPPQALLHTLPSHKASLLQLQPRFPLLGGWNYTFEVGFTLPLSKGWLKTILDPTRTTTGGKEYVATLPFFTPLTDVAIDEATVNIILPEGAEALELSLPAGASLSHRVTKTYLDTRGRDTLVLRRERCSEKVGGYVFVRYRLEWWQHARKVVAVAAVVVGLFAAAGVGRRVDLRIR